MLFFSRVSPVHGQVRPVLCFLKLNFEQSPVHAIDAGKRSLGYHTESNMVSHYERASPVSWCLAKFELTIWGRVAKSTTFTYVFHDRLPGKKLTHATLWESRMEGFKLHKSPHILPITSGGGSTDCQSGRVVQNVLLIKSNIFPGVKEIAKHSTQK